jgi:phosphate transport system permease protein
VHKSDRAAKIISFISSCCGMAVLILIFAEIIKESSGFFQNVSPIAFLTGSVWQPLSTTYEFGMLPMLLGTLYVTLVALVLAVPTGVGTAIFMACYLTGRAKYFAAGLIDVLAGIPSVIYGFIGMLVLLPMIEKIFSLSSGESVLAAGIIVSVMILPYITAACVEVMDKLYEKYALASAGLGVSRWHMAIYLILPSGGRGILAGIVLGAARGLGETMAVLMVAGNADLMPRLLGKTSVISAKIALEMGMAAVGSVHYQALFAAATVLMAVTLAINIIFYFIKRKLRENV